jgi:hypothetical protein
MHWPKKLAVSTWHSLWGPLTGASAPSGAANQPALAVAHAHLQALRQAMLDALQPGASINAPHVDLVRKILHARSVEGLWYARDDLMVALASDHGEAAARATLAQLSQRFEGLLPEAASLKARPAGPRRR